MLYLVFRASYCDDLEYISWFRGFGRRHHRSDGCSERSHSSEDSRKCAACVLRAAVDVACLLLPCGRLLFLVSPTAVAAVAAHAVLAALSGFWVEGLPMLRFPLF